VTLQTIVFEGWGLRITYEDDQYIAEYGSGESAGSRLLQRLITAEQAARAMQSEDSAYRVLLEVDDIR
jgi:L-amino acid N-acyltransferase YncA